MVDAIAGVRERLDAARSVCVLTGSGPVAEGGLPTFRGVQPAASLATRAVTGAYLVETNLA